MAALEHFDMSQTPLPYHAHRPDLRNGVIAITVEGSQALIHYEVDVIPV